MSRVITLEFRATSCTSRVHIITVPSSKVVSPDVAKFASDTTSTGLFRDVPGVVERQDRHLAFEESNSQTLE